MLVYIINILDPEDVNCIQIANSRTSVTKTICAFANS